jgi:hypothetical protein
MIPRKSSIPGFTSSKWFFVKPFLNVFIILFNDIIMKEFKLLNNKKKQSILIENLHFLWPFTFLFDLNNTAYNGMF